MYCILTYNIVSLRNATFVHIIVADGCYRYIKMSSPNMNNMILAGCMLTYSSVFLLGLDGRLVSNQVFPLVCSVKSVCFYAASPSVSLASFCGLSFCKWC